MIFTKADKTNNPIPPKKHPSINKSASKPEPIFSLSHLTLVSGQASPSSPLHTASLRSILGCIPGSLGLWLCPVSSCVTQPKQRHSMKQVKLLVFFLLKSIPGGCLVLNHAVPRELSRLSHTSHGCDAAPVNHEIYPKYSARIGKVLPITHS